MRVQYFAEFYKLSLNYDGNHPSHPVLACGSDGVMYLDGRYSNRRMYTIAKDEAKKRGFVGVRVCRGTFSNPTRVGVFESVMNLSDLQTISERIRS
jgi:hypothetical protein